MSTNKYLVARGLNSASYAKSIASTWIWAPALFVSSQIAYQYGLSGFLMFLIPNVLTLLIFGFVCDKFDIDFSTAVETVKKVGKVQEAEHLTITSALLIGSTFVQILGIHALLSQWFGVPRLVSAFAILGLSLLIIWGKGLKACIKTDAFKYEIIFLCGLVLILCADNNSVMHFGGHVPFDAFSLFLSFGLPTAIGLLSAPYADTTFWQRANSIEKGNRFKTFCFAGLFFATIPLLFSIIGFSAPTTENWQLQNFANSIFPMMLLAVAVLSALIATVDSNLCAIGALAKKGKENVTIIGFCALLTALFCWLDNLTIVDLFLLYGTLRTVASVPTILSLANRFDVKRLQIATGVAMIVCPIGFAFAQPYGNGWIFTVLALLIPLLGYKNNETSRHIPSAYCIRSID